MAHADKVRGSADSGRFVQPAGNNRLAWDDEDDDADARPSLCIDE